MAESPRAAHPSVRHHKQAARHLRAAADRHDEAAAHHERGEHATAHEVAKGAAAHCGEAQAHAHEAQRLHEAHEAQSLDAHPGGSHWNDPDFGPEPDDV